jgi:CheY-like chemotaxis protein
MTDPEATVLVVDDDPLLREALAEQLALLGHRVAMAPSAVAAAPRPACVVPEKLRALEFVPSRDP